MRRHSTLVALAVAVVVFVAMFLVLSQATDVIRLAGPAVLALLAAVGTQLALGRTAAQISDDAYADDAHQVRRDCLELVQRIRRAAGGVRNPSMQREVERIAVVVPELLTRVERTSPTSLYSSSSQLRGHLQSLLGVVETYAQIERKPAFYDQPERQLVAGEQAVRRFVDFGTESIRLVNQGDLASYQANLATAAPPELPRLGAPTTGQEQS